MNQSTSNDLTEDVEPTRSEQVIENIASRLDNKDVYSPVVDWRWFAALASGFLTLAMLSAVFIFGYVLREGQNDSQAAQEKNDAIETCARRYGTRVTNAQVENDLALDEVVLYLTKAPEERSESEEARIISNFKNAGTLLSQARDDRLEYEQTLVLPCPIKPLVRN